MSCIPLIAARLQAYKKWSKEATRKVKEKYRATNPDRKPPEGLYKESPARISQELLKRYDYDKAMSQLNFVDNRSGRKTTPADRQKLDKAKDLMRKKKPVKPGKSIVTKPPGTAKTPDSTARTPKSTAKTPRGTATKPKSYA